MAHGPRGTRSPLGAEVLSEGNADNDLEVKVHLYAAMGVPDRLQPGGHALAGLALGTAVVPPGADGAYVQQPAAEAYHSRVLGVLLCMWDDPQELQDAADGVKLRYRAAPRLQVQGRAGHWHDAVANRERAIWDGGR